MEGGGVSRDWPRANLAENKLPPIVQRPQARNKVAPIVNPPAAIISSSQRFKGAVQSVEAHQLDERLRGVDAFKWRDDGDDTACCHPDHTGWTVADWQLYLDMIDVRLYFGQNYWSMHRYAKVKRKIKLCQGSEERERSLRLQQQRILSGIGELPYWGRRKLKEKVADCRHELAVTTNAHQQLAWELGKLEYQLESGCTVQMCSKACGLGDVMRLR